MGVQDTALTQALQQGYLMLGARRRGIPALEGQWRKHCWDVGMIAIVVVGGGQRVRLRFDLMPARIEFRDTRAAWEVLTAGLAVTEWKTQVLWSDGGSIQLARPLVPVYVTRLQQMQRDDALCTPEPFYEAHRQRHAARRTPGKEPDVAVKLYRSEHGYAVQTECPTEAVFMDQCVQLLGDLIAKDTYGPEHWPSVLAGWLPLIVNICCAYRGYKTPEVEMRTLYTAGAMRPVELDAPTHTILDDAQLLHEALAASNGAGAETHRPH